MKPYNSFGKNGFEIFNEWNVLTLSYFALVILRERHYEQQAISLIIAYLVRLAVMYNVSTILFSTIKKLFLKCRKKYWKRKAKKKVHLK